ncbi:DoxX family protein [Nonomuraea sp. NPDC050310]|uniref:DoxX family protein n=1 Tax=unclassified Nonomuraea TaxID=2593643 RepID=UPI0033F97B4F
MKKVPVDIAALIARIVLGVIFVAHGWQKWQNGIDATTQMFTQAGVPQPQLAATFTMVAELVGGALLILGLFVRVAALLLLAVTIGAMIFVHFRNGIFIADNGWELVGALGAGCLMLMATGGGRLGLDGLYLALRRRNKARDAAQEELSTARQAREDAERKAAEARTEAAEAEAARAADREARRDAVQESTGATRDVARDAADDARDSARDARHSAASAQAAEETRPNTVPQQAHGLSEADRRDIDALLADEKRRGES